MTSSSAITQSLPSRSAKLAVAALLVAGFALTILVFYPGYMTIDALWVYESIKLRSRGDWQSPVMSVIWGWIDPMAPGSMSMLLLMAGLYWSGLAAIAWAAMRRSAWLGLAVPLLALLPPAFAFTGLIWRDVLFADAWLFGAAITYAATEGNLRLRGLVQTVALGFVAFGVLLRPNAIIAAPLLAAYVIWPTFFSWKRAVAVLVPGVLAGFVLIQIVYYGMLGVERQHPLHSLLVFDLGGITYLSGANQFPVSWSPAQNALLLTPQCYNPTKWDFYWMIEPCKFVMDRLEDKTDRIFGTPKLTDAWLHAVVSHPLAYLSHRANFMWTFLARSNLVMPVWDLDHPTRAVHAQNPFFMGLVAVHNALQPTVLFRLGLWLVLAIVVCILAWPARMTASGAFALGVNTSAIAYVGTFFLFGVAADFRYGYWGVLAPLFGFVAASAARQARP